MFNLFQIKKIIKNIQCKINLPFVGYYRKKFFKIKKIYLRNLNVVLDNPGFLIFNYKLNNLLFKFYIRLRIYIKKYGLNLKKN